MAFGVEAINGDEFGFGHQAAGITWVRDAAAVANEIGGVAFGKEFGDAAAGASTNGNDGALLDDPDWVDGKFGKALQFDGSSDANSKVTFPSGTGNVGDEISISLWVKENTDGGYWISNKSGDGAGGYELRSAGSNGKAYWRGSSSQERNRDVSTNWGGVRPGGRSLKIDVSQRLHIARDFMMDILDSRGQLLY